MVTVQQKRPRPKYLELWKLTKTFDGPKGPVSVVKDFDLNVAEGEFVSLIGHSGCGKSTVLVMVAGLAAKSGGAIILADREVRGPGPDRGVVFQAPCLLPWLSAFDNVMLGINQVYPDATRQQRRDVAAHYLSLVGLGESMHKKPDELSGGMRQRVGIARAFALSPKMLLLDEPFGMLDQLTRFELQQVLLELWRKDREDGPDGDPRCGRGPLPLRPGRHDDQRPGSAARGGAERAVPPPAQPRGGDGGPGLLPPAGAAHRFPGGT